MSELRSNHPSTAHGQGGDIMKLFEGPTEDSLDERQRALVAAGREAFRELEKLMKSIGLYGLRHPNVDRFRQRLCDAMGGMLAGYEVVEIGVGPYELTVHDQVVYQNPHPEKNFVYKFYMDGLRTIRLHEGITPEELATFVGIVLTDWTDPSLFEDDSVTLLWSSDFQHLDYVVIESFAEDAKEGEELDYTVAGVVDKVRQGAEPESEPGATPGAATPGGGAGGAVGASGRAGRPRRAVASHIIPGVALTEVDLERFEEHPFAMDQVEFDMLRAVITTTGRETLEKFIEILFKVNMVEDAGDQRAVRIVGLFDRIADLLLETGRVGELERLLRKVRRLKGRGDDEIPENVEAIRRIFEHWATAEFLEKVTAGLDEPGFRFAPSVLAICRLLNREAAPHLALRAGKVQVPEHRQALFELLPHFLPGHERAVAELLRQVDQAHAHELFRVLKAVAEPQHVIAAIRIAMSNPDANVRLEALSSLPNNEVTRHLELLYRCLRDAAKPVRSKAIHLLARIPTPEVHARILNAIQQKEFQDLELDEKRRYFAAAALTGNPNEQFLEHLRSGGLINRKGQDELRHCAAIALGIRLCRDAVPLFEKEVARRLRSEVVAEACAWSLQHMQCDRSTRTRQLYDIFFRSDLGLAVQGAPHG